MDYLDPLSVSAHGETRKINTGIQQTLSSTGISLNNAPSVVANCYVFKSRLQEYAQKVGIATPVYDTYMEGPSHVPVFRSSVIVNEVTYYSLPGFFNRKAAEQSAAEVALLELSKSGQITESIPTVHETGLCKNLLQEYAQKMNYAIPLYSCTKQPSGTNSFICTVEIHGIQYIGAAAKTKKEAEIKAARTALLAIQTASLASGHGTSAYTVLPGKKKVMETEQRPPDVEKPLKAKRTTKFKKKWPRRRTSRRKKDACSDKSCADETSKANAEARGAAPTGNDDQAHDYLEMLDREMKLQLEGLGVQENEPDV
ncbi:Double-stranded RNA-binding protein 8 [Platanthera guangdongensis]|uniref:Double-stranded RNA-binding protein 8 n=1 Tax=Platanthera guangdongensis TaxID=2320717 RepID=A0ABR2MQV7_9ASPA